MIDEHYEKVYCEARDVLFRRGKRVSKPRVASDNLRRCAVSGALLTDRELFIEAWGAELADEIITPTLKACFKTDDCQECERLWEEYTEVAARYGGLRKAGANVLTELAKQRSRARSLLLGHTAYHHHAWPELAPAG